ncbi:MAG: flagellar biosynthetic protein FliO [Rhodoferax sp.]|uniref:flagellar biosynthetic protein FliO n=1 Tax=Rhodoferax sp. TaxID=50421 RepID=UPI0026188CFE|nr:flagellar biosynthetic protein FliO [Rhodoferax sp.]MDD5335602.1 flagellar biosynthetic protein FliO [Rhodoferax sp.]
MKWRRLPGLAACLLAGFSGAVGAALPTVPAAAPEAAPSHAAAGLLQAGFGLALVVGLIFLCAWAVRRFGLQPSGGNRLLKVVSSVMVGQRERVVVVEIGDSWLVLGVSAGQVRALHTMAAQARPETGANPAENAPGAASAFSQTLLQSLNHLNPLRKHD